MLPLSYLLHLGEEWWGGEGFAAWTARAVGSPVSTTRFLVLNGIVWPVFLMLTIVAILRPRWAWFPVAFATVVLINAALHVLGTLASASYSPGSITGALLYVPVGIAALVHGKRVVSPPAFRGGVVLGVLIHAAVVVVAFA